MLPENGSRRTGRSVHSPRQRLPIGWERLLPMLDDMRYLHWLGSRGRTTLMRRPSTAPGPGQATVMLEKFLGELPDLVSTEQLTEWSFRSLPIKSTLAVHDARSVEEAFQAK